MSDDYLWDRSGEPDPEVARLEKALAGLRHEGEWREPVAEPRAPQRRPRRTGLFLAGGALALAAAVALAIGASKLWLDPQGKTAGVASSPAVSSSPSAPPRPEPSPCVTAQEGFAFEAPAEVTCGGGPARAGKLPAGVWIETPADVTASVQVADIGAITLRGGSRLRIVETSAREHRLELVAGSLHAKVNAPPRLFVIDTRAATAVDLGCAYDLAIDGAGRTHLHVTSGAVSLEGKGRVAYVPRGAEVTADPDRGPGAVISDRAGKSMIAATERLDAGDALALADVLAVASREDSVTLWNLLASASKEARSAIVRRLDELKLRPAKVSREALLAGRAEAIDALREHLEDDWFADRKVTDW